MMKEKFNYLVSWDGPNGMRYQQDFENITEARIALAAHNSRDSELTIKKKSL